MDFKTKMTGYDSGIAQRKEFLRWVRKTVPDEYRHKEETPNCFSPVIDFMPLRETGLTCKSLDLFFANNHTEKKFTHIFKEDNPCDRCLRMLSASALFHSKNHPELFTSVAKGIIELEDKERKIEKIEEDYKGDGLYLVQIETPFIGNDQTMQDTHLIFYDEYSIRHGERIMKQRIYNSHNPDISELAKFSEPTQYHFKKNFDNYFLVYSQNFFKEKKGHKNTRLEILSHKID